MQLAVFRSTEQLTIFPVLHKLKRRTRPFGSGTTRSSLTFVFCSQKIGTKPRNIRSQAHGKNTGNENRIYYTSTIYFIRISPIISYTSWPHAHSQCDRKNRTDHDKNLYRNYKIKLLTQNIAWRVIREQTRKISGKYESSENVEKNVNVKQLIIKWSGYTANEIFNYDIFLKRYTNQKIQFPYTDTYCTNHQSL